MKYKIISKIKEKIYKYKCIIIFINKKYNKINYYYKKIINKNIKINKILNKKPNIYKIFNNKQYIYLIVYKNTKINKHIFKKLVIKSFKIINKKNYNTICLFIKNIKFKNIYWKIFNFVKIIEYKTYKFLKFKTKVSKKINNIIYFKINSNQKKKSIKIIKNSLIISKGINKTRDLCNMPPNICNSDYIFKKTKKEIYGKNIKISFLNKKQMKKLEMNAYLSVNKGSNNKPIIIKIKYNNNTKSEKPIILIGKGITFDSGGISLKNSNYMHEMKYDMSGAAVVWGIMYIINKLNLKLNVIGILLCAENLIDGKSTKPGTIIKTLSGKTVEIINTDAEGRLLICDALSYINKYNPKIVIDIATLTGCCLIALGNKISALITNNKSLSKDLIKASKKSNDNIWELPLYKKYNKYLKSHIADIKNCSENNYAGTITAACFLNNFIKKYKWAHLDIAGTAWNKKGPTGRTVYLLINYLKNKIKNKKKYNV